MRWVQCKPECGYLKLKADAEGRTQESLSIDEEEELYQQALQTILERDEGKTWAEGNIRMGEIILLIDCDTRVVGLLQFHAAMYAS